MRVKETLASVQAIVHGRRKRTAATNVERFKKHIEGQEFSLIFVCAMSIVVQLDSNMSSHLAFFREREN